MWTTSFGPAAAKALRLYARIALPAANASAGPLASRSIVLVSVVARRSFLVAPSYKSRLAVRGYATATKKKTTTTRARSTATKKKPAAKKTTRKTTRKAAAGKRKKTAKRVKAKPKKRQVRKKSPATLKLEDRRQCKRVSLLQAEPKKQLPISIWTVYTTGLLKGVHISAKEMGTRMKELAQTYKTLPAADIERLHEAVERNKLANEANYKAWVESHPVTEVLEANKARRRLMMYHKVPLKAGLIKDARIPTRPANSYALFIRAKFASNPGTTTVKQNAKEFAREWRGLPAPQRKTYDDLAKAESEKYHREMARIGGN